MLPNFTVFELLFFYARLKLPRKTTNRECFVMAQEVINCLGLAHIRHSIIGDASRRGISGGQKKRVNVAMEMVGDPSLIFLDEPTSGLDSTTSNDVLNALKVMSRSNVNIILVRSSDCLLECWSKHPERITHFIHNPSKNTTHIEIFSNRYFISPRINSSVSSIRSCFSERVVEQHFTVHPRKPRYISRMLSDSCVQRWSIPQISTWTSSMDAFIMSDM